MMVKRVPIDTYCEKKIPTLQKTYDGLIDYVDISSVDNAEKKIISYQTIDANDAPSRAKQLLKQGDVLVSTVRPNLNAVAVVEEETENLMVGSTGYCVLRCKDTMNVRYLFNFCQSQYFVDDMSSQATGASYPAVSNGIVRSSLIPCYSIEEQKEIAEKMDTVSKLLALRKQQLAKLDELVKSRFIEMFGEVGTNTKSWGLKRLSDCCTVNPKKGEDKRLHQDLMVSFVPMPAVSEKGDIDASETRSYDEVKTGFTYFAEQDVLFAKITPCMENGKGAVAKGLCNGIGFGSTEFHVLRPIEGVSNPYWLYAVTAFKQFRMDAASNMTGSAGQRRVPASFLDAYKISVPPIELQIQFASFVEQTDKLKFDSARQIYQTERVKTIYNYFR